VAQPVSTKHVDAKPARRRTDTSEEIEPMQRLRERRASSAADERSANATDLSAALTHDDIEDNLSWLDETAQVPPRPDGPHQ
jgi:hypothetical protein